MFYVEILASNEEEQSLEVANSTFSQLCSNSRTLIVEDTTIVMNARVENKQ